MSLYQYFAIGAALMLCCVLYILPTTSDEVREVSKQRSISLEPTSKEILIRDAKKELDEDRMAQVLRGEDLFRQATDESSKIEALKQLSGIWFRVGSPIVAGIYAAQIAEKENTGEAWSIAGTTYTLALKKNNLLPKDKAFARKRAVEAFESAISLEPETVNHRINLALCYVEAPVEDNPMKGILMLKEVQEKHPENVSVLVQLGRLAVNTGQFDKALERLERARELDAGSPNIHYWLSKAYEGKGDMAKASESLSKFKELSEK